MELRQLEYLVAVVDEGSFTRGAARVHVAQSGVSAQIRRLERELGHDLLDRSTRTVRPTEVGAAVLPFARAALDAVAGARQAIDELAGLVRGHVTMGVVVSVSASEVADIPGLLADFHAEHPGVEITLTEGDSGDMLAWLQAGRIDLAIVGIARTLPAGIATQDLRNERVFAAVAPGDPLARRASVSLAGLRDRTLITLPRGTGIRRALDDACAAARVRPRIAFEASDPRALAQLAARGLGVAILPESLATSYPPDELRGIAIARPEICARLALAWRDDGAASPAARALVGHARRAL